MKYTKKTLEELKKIIDRAALISQGISGSVAFRNHLDAQAGKNSLSEDQRQAAAGLRNQTDAFTQLGLDAQTASANIQKLLDGNVQEPAALEEQIDATINALKEQAGVFTAAADRYFIWDDHDKTPEFSDPAWPMYDLSKELDDAGKNLEVLQMADGIHQDKEIDKQLEDEMMFLSAMSCDGIDLTRVPEMLNNAKSEAEEAKNRLEALKSAEEKQRWQKQQEDANLRIVQIPEQIRTLEKNKQDADQAVRDAERDLQGLQQARRQYDEIRREMEENGRNADGFRQDIDGLQQELASLKEKTTAANESYQRYMQAYADRAGGRAIDFFWPYVESKERELRWSQVQDLAGQLGNIIWEDTTLLNTFVSEIAKNSQRSAGAEPQQDELNRAALSEENRGRLDKINEIVAKMMRIAPDKQLLNDLLVPKKFPVNDAGKYLDELTTGVQQLIDTNVKDFSDNVLFRNTQKKTEEIQKMAEAFQKNAEIQQKDAFATRKEKKARQKTTKGLAAEIAKQNKDIAIDAVNTNELDALISSHISTEMEQAAGDAKQDVLNWKRDDCLKQVERLNTRLSNKRNETEFTYMSYQLGNQGAEQGGNENFLDRLEQAITSSAEKNRNRRDNDIPQTIERYKNELDQQKENVEKYSLNSYKKALVDAQLDSEKKNREVTKLSAINKHLKTARDLYNRKTDALKRASSSLTKETETIMNGIDAFLKDFDKNKKTDHSNSDEYKAIKTALEDFKNGDAQDKTPEQLKNLLGTLKEKATAYRIKKNKQWFHWRPSGQRKFRLNQADNIERFCDAHTALIDSMDLTAATHQEIRDFDANPPADNLNAEQFGIVAQGMKAQYDDKISTFKTIMLESKNINARRFDGGEQLTDEARKNLVIDALVNNEVEKELYHYDPEKESFGRHVLDLQHLKNTARESIEKNQTEFINQAVQNSKDHPEMSGADIAKSRNQQEAGKKYRNFTSYDQNLPEAAVNAGEPVNREANNGAINNDRAMVPQ